jgi:NAD(P)-dependent dehydrogenase (short-subunit alcohol dehydrogenase family)
MVGDDAAAANIPRRIPTAVLRPDLELCAPTGVTINEDSRIVVMVDEGGIGKKLVKRLEKLGATVLTLEDAPDAEELRNRLDAFAADGAIQGVYWLPALDPEAAIADMDLADWREAVRIRVKLLFETMRHLYDSIGKPGTFLVSATRLGGRHGYDAAGAVAPMGGAVSGFTKAFKREKPDALVKVVDFEAGRKTAGPAEALIAETFSDPGAVEIGLAEDLRWTVSVVTEELPEEPAGVTLDADSVFVVTGAAGSIVSAITADLARASGGVFHLLDLIPEPDRDDADIAAFAADKDGLKRTIFERLKASGERATPAMVEREIAGIERSHAALAAIHAIEAAGGTVHYHSVNLLDGDAVTVAMADVRDLSGKVDVLLHAGGLEISRLLPDKERSEYDLVFDVKADGWFNLLKGLGDTPIGATVGFSSVAGRFGNNGQTDYSAANDLLCKYASSFRTTRPDTLGIAIDWTAWGDIGMATRGSIPTVMKAVGIDMLPAAAGIPIVRRELTGRSVGGEVVIGQRLGLLLDEFEATGGLDVSDEGKLSSLLGTDAVVQTVSRFGIYSGLVATAELDPTVQPFLFDHQIEGTAVLPGVMGVETFAEVARLAFPDRAIAAVEDVNFMAPFKFYRDEPRTVEVAATFTLEGNDVVADCRLIGTRTLANQPEPQRTVHFTGRVRLSPEAADLESTDVPEVGEPVADAAAIYRIFFHGPTYQVLDRAGRAGGVAVGRYADDLPPNHLPETLGTATWPRLAELAFQTSGVLEIGRDGTMALPMHIDRVTFAGNPAKAKGRIHAVVTPSNGGFNVRVADDKGTTFVDMQGYQTVQLPTPLDEDAVTPLHDAMTS